LTLEADCTDDWDGEWVTCDPNPCPQPGACCYVDGSCEYITEDTCTDPSVESWSAAVECDPINPCVAAIAGVAVEQSGSTYNWTVNSSVDLSSLEGWYRRGGEEVYQEIDNIQEENATTWSAHFPSEAYTLRGVEFYIVFQTASGAVGAYGNASQPRRIPFEGSVQAPALPPLIYRMLSAPLLVDGRDDSWALLDSLFGPTGSKNWLMGRWDRSATEYTLVDQNHRSAFEPGAAYWIGFVGEQEWELEGVTSFPPDGKDSYEINLPPGWTMAGNPAAYVCPGDPSDLTIVNSDSTESTLAEAIAENRVSRIYVYDLGTAQETWPYRVDPASLEMWEGFWINNRSRSEVVTLRIPALSVDGLARTATGRERVGVALPWSVAIDAQTESERSVVVIGLASSAESGHDGFDLLQPPPAFVKDLSFGLVPFGSGEPSAAGELLLRDVRPSSNASVDWVLALSSPEAPVELRWTVREPAEGSEGHFESVRSLTLIDEEAGRRWNMESLRSLVLPGGEHSLRVEARIESGTWPEERQLDILADPNPFFGETAIHCRLDETSHVNMEIFDALGVRIWRHEERAVPAGEHVVVWNGASSEGADLPAGTYFLRSELVSEKGVPAGAGSKTSTFKITLVR
jgi:hypothetical protein